MGGGGGGGGGGFACEFDEELYTSHRFVYGRNQRTVTHIVKEEWYWDGVSDTIGDYRRTLAREFRYDGAGRGT